MDFAGKDNLDAGAEREWSQYDLGLAEQLDEYWDRLQSMVAGPSIDPDVLACFPFTDIREVPRS